MSDIDRIKPGNPIIPPVPQDREIDERKKKQRDNKKEKPADGKDDNGGDNDNDGIDYYA